LYLYFIVYIYDMYKVLKTVLGEGWGGVIKSKVGALEGKSQMFGPNKNSWGKTLNFY